MAISCACATAGVGHGQSTFVPTSGTQSWNVATNWNPNGIPNGIGVATIFNSPNGAVDQVVTLDAAITVGSISITNNGSGTTQDLFINPGSGGSLAFDVASGEATVIVSGTNPNNNNVTISAGVTLNDTLRLTNNITASAGTGIATATFTGTVGGAGGFVKDGPGRFTFSTVAKTYTGATTVNQGRLRYTSSGLSTGTSSVTVNSGGSLYLDTDNGTWSFGGGAALITINGTGDGSATATLGALRNQGSETNTLANPVTLGSDATIHVQVGGSILQLNGNLSGSSLLTKTGNGTLQLTQANASLTGATTINAGTISVDAGSRIGPGRLTLAQSAGVNATALTLNNAAQTVQDLTSAFTDATGTRAQTITLNGTALTINQTQNTTFGGGSISTLTSTITGTGSVLLSDTSTGTLTLTGNNTYSGGTTINGGTLLANGQTGANSGTGTGLVTVNVTGTLGGNGIVAGGVMLAGGGRIRGGIGGSAVATNTLAVGGDLTTSATAILEAVVGHGGGAGTASRLNITGALTGGGVTTLRLVNDGSLVIDGSTPYTVTLASYGSTTLTPSNFALDTANFALQGSPSINVGATALTVTFTPVPEPAAVLGVAAAGLAAGGFVRRRLRKPV